MADITHGTWIKDGTPVDKVFSDGKQVYGRNLILRTNNVLTTTNGNGWGTGQPSYSLPEALKTNQTYTLSCYLEPVEHDVCVCMSTTTRGNIFGTTVTAGSKGISTLTITFTQEDVEVPHSVWVTWTNEQTDLSTVSGKGFKFEKGSIATPWTPAPEDILK